MRAFIVGNGPSLNNTPLHLLKDEVTFAVNRIHLLYPQTDWRPTHYVRSENMRDVNADSELWADDLLVHLNDPEITVWCNQWFIKNLWRLGYEDEWGKVNVIEGCAHFQQDFDSENAPVLWHLPRLCTFGSVVNVACQIAVQQGFDELYLLGCDMGAEHFVADYTKGYELLDNNLNSLCGHIQAAKSQRQNQVKIYNATVGGELEVFERISLDEVLRDR